MANIVGCEVVSLESYFKSEQVKDFKHDDFSALDLPLLSKVTFDLRNLKGGNLSAFGLSLLELNIPPYFICRTSLT